MRKIGKVGGVLLAVAVVLPIGLVAPDTASSATTGLTCKKLAGVVTWTPPVPLKVAAKSNILLKGTLSGCTGTPKITSGVIALPVIKTAPARTCATLLNKPPKITQAGGSITWATTKTKSTLGVLTLTPAGPLNYKATAKVTKGQFLNKTLTMTGKFTPNAPGCPLKSAKLALKAGTKAVIK